MIKKWKQFINESVDYDSLDDQQKAFVDSLSDDKSKYLLVMLLKGGQEDMDTLSEQVSDFHDIEPDVTRLAHPYTLYYGTEWWAKQGVSIKDLRSKIQEEATNLGIKVKIFTHMISERDFEMETDIPARFLKSGDSAFKRMNGINENWTPDGVDGD